MESSVANHLPRAKITTSEEMAEASGCFWLVLLSRVVAGQLA